MGDYTVGDLVAEFLARCGVEVAFGIVSVHNIPMLDAIGRRNRIRFVMTRGEMGAAHMADGYARAGGRLGVVFSSTGPGAANTVPGLVEARFASSPVLHVTGAGMTKFAGRDVGTVHEIPDQIGMLRSVSKAAFRVSTPSEALGVLTKAATTALTAPMGPVSLEIPIDVQRTAIERPSALDTFVLPVPEPRTPTGAELDDLADRVASAERPLLWLGAGALEAGPAARRLLDLGFGMVTSWAGRGSVPEDHPQNFGTFTGNGMPAVQAFYATCDLMLVAGSRLRGLETGDFTVKLPPNLMQIDVDPAANGRSYPVTHFVCGDARATLDGLADRLDGRLSVDPGFADEVSTLKDRTRAAYRETLGPYADVPGELRRVVPADAVWARDITISNSTWGHRLFTLTEPRQNVYPVSAGIGQGLCLGIGAALAAAPRKTVVMTGDGGFVLNIGEFWTAVQERLDLVVLVMNDKGYGVIRQIQDKVAEGRHHFADMTAPDLGKLADLAGVPFWRISEVGELAAMVGEAVATTGPTLVEVDMSAIGAHPPYYPFGPELPA